MRRTLILLIYLAIINMPAQCATTIFPPLQAIKPNLPQPSSDVGEQFPNTLTQNPILEQNYSNIGKIEHTLFGKTFSNQNIATRLSRIEKTLFTKTYPDASESQRIDNIISNFNQINKYPNISKNVLTKLENKVFNQNFQQNSPERRIERLEQQVFGAAQGGDMDSRYNTLQTAVRDYNSSSPNDDSDFYNSAPKTGLRGLMGTLGDSMLGGSMTGFTPMMSPYMSMGGNGMSPYNSGYNNGINNYNSNSYGNLCPPSGSGIYRGCRTNTGYHESYSDFGSGAGVTILD